MYLAARLSLSIPPEQPGWCTLETQSKSITRRLIYTYKSYVSYLSVSGLQSGSGEWFSLKPVPKSWAFFPNTIFHSREGGLYHGSTCLVHSSSILQTHCSVMCGHIPEYVSFFTDVCCPLQTSCSCGQIMGTQWDKHPLPHQTKVQSLCSVFDFTMVFVCMMCYIFSHHSM